MSMRDIPETLRLTDHQVQDTDDEAHQDGALDSVSDVHPQFKTPQETTSELSIQSEISPAQSEADQLRDLANRIKIFVLILLALTLYLTHDALTTLEPFQLRQVMFSGQTRVTQKELYDKLQHIENELQV